MSRVNEVRDLCTIAICNPCEEMHEVKKELKWEPKYVLGSVFVHGVDSVVEALQDVRIPKIGDIVKGRTVTEITAEFAGKHAWEVWITGR